MGVANTALVNALTVMEVIINFIIDMYRSTFLCFLDLVVKGGLAIVISAVQEVCNLLIVLVVSYANASLVQHRHSKRCEQSIDKYPRQYQ